MPDLPQGQLGPGPGPKIEEGPKIMRARERNKERRKITIKSYSLIWGPCPWNPNRALPLDPTEL